MRSRETGLRTGWTTGSCAAAAAKAAAICLVTGRPVEETDIELPAGNRVTFAVGCCQLSRRGQVARAAVVKDAGDDPDVTHGAQLVAVVSWLDRPGVLIEGGPGVGVVTLPGLGLPVGQAAINPTPRAMITHAVGEALSSGGAEVPPRGLRVVISVPGGERLAKRTLNARLGILGGISILGTTGVVRPFSTESWRMSVERAVAVAAASGGPTLVLCTGGRTERAAMALCPGLPPPAFVEVADFTGAALAASAGRGFQRVTFVGMMGKLTKLATGVVMTHAAQSSLDVGILGEITREAGGNAALAEDVARANTARHAYELWERASLLTECGAVLCSRVAEVLRRHSADLGGPTEIDVALVDFTGNQMITRIGVGWADR